MNKPREAMRRYILTERERQRLTDWIPHDEEDDGTRKLFHIWRYSYSRRRDDIRVLIPVTKKLSPGGCGRPGRGPVSGICLYGYVKVGRSSGR